MSKSRVVAVIVGLLGMFSTANAETTSLKTADLRAIVEAGRGTSKDLYPLMSKLGFAEDRILAFEDNPFFACMVGQTANPVRIRRIFFLKPAGFLVEDDFGSQPAKQDSIPFPGGDKEINGIAIPTEGKHRIIHFLAVGQPVPRPEVQHDGDTLALKINQSGRVYRLWLPGWDLKTGQTGTIAIDGADDKSLMVPRPLAAGVLPHSPEGIKMIEGWDRAYRGGGKPGWDTGRPAPDLVKAVEEGKLKPCRVVELGCGSGTNALYLAQKGFETTAIDIAPTAIAIAQARSKKANVRVRFLVADVLALPELGSFDLIFDRGCYHGVRKQNAPGYVKTVSSLSHPGTLLLILAGNANEKPHYGPPRVSEEQLRGDFSKMFDFVDLHETHFDTGRAPSKGPLAWFALLRRQGKP